MSPRDIAFRLAGVLALGLAAFPALADQVILDDLIVQGSTCIGFDCVNNENFDFDTLRLKENNLRINFDDTSAVSGFPTTNWQIRANSKDAGGGDFFAIVDQGATGTSETGTIVFSVAAGARAHALNVNNPGRIGLGTAAPVLDLHFRSGNTPALRLEQDGSSGFSPQTWDIGANETNFFIRDATNGSRLPIRIVPGAPSNSIFVAATGNIGVGTNAPTGRLHVEGDTVLNGDFSVLSSRQSKMDFSPVDSGAILSRLADLPLMEWSYTGNGGVRHLGPIAEDFYEKFPLGRDKHSVNPLDVAGVALAAIQGLRSELLALAEESEATRRHLDQREREIAALVDDRAALAARVATLEQLVANMHEQ